MAKIKISKTVNAWKEFTQKVYRIQDGDEIIVPKDLEDRVSYAVLFY